MAVVALALIAAGQAVAQDNASTVSNSTVGPSDLRDFNLGGSATSPAETPPPASAPVPVAPAAKPVPKPATVPSAAPPGEGSRETAARTARESSNAVLNARPSLPPVAGQAAPQPPPGPSASSASLPTATPDRSMPWWPWLVASLFAAGAAAWWFYGRQRTPAYGSARMIDLTPLSKRAPDSQPSAVPASGAAQPLKQAADPIPPAPGPRHDPVPAARRPVPTNLLPPSAAPGSASPLGGIVATGLRPWVEVELVPDRALVDGDGAAIAFEVWLANSGNAPARDVIIEACLLNAGEGQDSQLNQFFGQSPQSSDAIPVIAPMAKVALRSAVRLPRPDIQEYDIEGRKIFVPLVAVSVRYRWSGGHGQTGAGFLVGRDKQGEQRLGAFRLDQGARSWDGLASRRYEKGLRS